MEEKVLLVVVGFVGGVVVGVCERCIMIWISLLSPQFVAFSFFQ